MKAKLLHPDIHWGFLAQGLSVAAGLLLLPLVLHYLPTKEVGLWFVFVSLAGLAQLLELGFQPTIARNVAYVYAGAQKLTAEGFEANSGNLSLNIELLQQLFAAAKKIYFRISIVALVILVVVGSAYISTIISVEMSWLKIIIAWVAFALGYVINFYYGYFNSFLQGRGEVTAANKVVVASRVTMILMGCLFLVAGWGLIGLGVASLISSVISRMMASRFFWHEEVTLSANLSKVRVARHNPLMAIIWPNASKLGWVFLGAFLITRANVFIATSFLGLVEVASYGLTFQVLSTFAGLATVVLNLKMPRINSHQLNGVYSEIMKDFGLSLVAALLVFSVCALVLLAFGSEMLEIVGSKTHLLGTTLLILFSVVMLLEVNHSVCASYLTTFNDIPFVKAALWSGVGIVIISILAVSVFHLGIGGLILSQGLVQLTYNNWKWPQEAAKKLGCSFYAIISVGFQGMLSFKHG